MILGFAELNENAWATGQVTVVSGPVLLSLFFVLILVFLFSPGLVFVLPGPYQ